MTTSWASLYLDFANGMDDYIARHIANYSRIQTCLDYLNAVAGGGAALLDVPSGLQQIFDRNGIIGRESYEITNATLGSPYNLVIPGGAAWINSVFYSKETSTTIAMGGFATGTYYVNLDGAGNPSVSASTSGATIWQFSWNQGSHVISAAAIYSGIAVLFDGDDYNDCLSSEVFEETFTSLADRLEYIETILNTVGNTLTDYVYDEAASSGLDFYYKGGKVRNDNVVTTTVDGYVTLANNDVSYIELNPADGVVSANTTGFTTGKIPLYQVTTSGGAITEALDKRAWLSAGSGEGGAGHTQNTDTGSTSPDFTLNQDEAGAPSENIRLRANRGTSPTVDIRWNEALDRWEYTNDGSTYNELGATTIDLGAQEISKFVPLENPPLVLEEMNRASSEDYEEIDLTASLADAEDIAIGVALRVEFFDTDDSIDYNVRFRKGGSIETPLVANTIYTAAKKDFSRPQVLVIPSSLTNTIEFFVSASGADTASVRVYLLGYFKQIVGVGTQNKAFTQTGLSAPQNATTEFELTGFVNRALIRHFEIVQTGPTLGTTFEVRVYGKDTFLAADLQYEVVTIPGDGTVWKDILPWFYCNEDGNKKLYMTIKNNAADIDGTFDLVIKAEQFA